METGLPAAALATGDDVHSALARLKYVIHVLRDCYSLMLSRFSGLMAHKRLYP